MTVICDYVNLVRELIETERPQLKINEVELFICNE